ncbi:MAG TPA: helix-turn-helix transcriptional regulator [Solirubrobacteraceae bacterium]|nr:helix-turn-helix transcriptional regulator [Solirubrobacteraceae bacterium]
MPPLSPLHAAFGDALRELRAERGISQEAVALEAGLNRGYYSGVERGVRNVSLTNMGKIAAALGVSLSEVFSRTERGAPIGHNDN